MSAVSISEILDHGASVCPNSWGVVFCRRASLLRAQCRLTALWQNRSLWGRPARPTQNNGGHSTSSIEPLPFRSCRPRLRPMNSPSANLVRSSSAACLVISPAIRRSKTSATSSHAQCSKMLRHKLVQTASEFFNCQQARAFACSVKDDLEHRDRCPKFKLS